MASDEARNPTGPQNGPYLDHVSEASGLSGLRFLVGCSQPLAQVPSALPVEV